MSVHLVLKWLHIISATVLFGTGLGIAFFQWFTFRQGNVHAIAAVTRIVVRADFLFTTPAVIVQLVTGLLLVHTLSLPWTTPWVILALALYVLVGACWLPVVVIQIRLARLAATASATGTALPEEFHRSMRTWFLLGWPAFMGMLAIFWLMVAKPTDFGL
jgi:uncharacterized membrane protein